ncbi:endonuclease domain-containing protein [Streptomyces sp. NPDC054933]
MPKHLPPPNSPCSHKAYQLSCDDYDRLVDHASGVCQICGAAPDQDVRGFLVVDHDAKVGQWAVRGLLCSDCNTALPAGSEPSWARAYLADPWWRRERIDEAVTTRQQQAKEADRLLVEVVLAAEAYSEARAKLEAALFAALRAPGARPARIAKASGWTAAYVRKLARAAGIEPDERYKERAERLKAPARADDA